MNKKIKSVTLDQLFEGILNLESKKECYQFFEDLCTIPELKDMALRFEVAKRLEAGESYQSIADYTQASTATISRVAKSLSYGADGYKLILKRLK